jgi:hypothetical protein
MIPMELQNVLDNTPENYDNEYHAHYHIKSAMTMFESFVSFHETVLRENMELKEMIDRMSKENQSAETKGDVKKVKKYIGYYIDENLAKSG